MRHLSLILVAGLLAMTGLAIADSKTVKDRRENTDNKLDIKSAAVGHASGKLRHTLELHGALPSRFSGDLCVQMLSKRARPVGPPGARAAETPDPDTKAHVACIQKKGQARADIVRLATGKVTGRANVTYPNARSVRFTFRKSAIGSPARYYWRADTAYESSKRSGRCPSEPMGFSCFDSAPEIGKEALHAL